MMGKKLKIGLLLLVLAVVVGIYHHRVESKLQNKDRIITVKSQPIHNVSYYTGTIQPLKTVVITSPVDGVVENIYFHSGDVVKPGQMLFTILSDKFQSDYKSSLVQYIKAKTDFMNADTQLKEAEFLHKNQLISDDDFKSKKINFYTLQLAMVQAKETLSNMLHQIGDNNLNPFDLHIEDTEKISQIFNERNTLRLQLSASREGIILSPSKSDGNGEIKIIYKGDQIKQGEVLAVIGNQNGCMVRINVSEFGINELKVGQSVKITGSAFPNIELAGEISGIEHQGQMSQNGIPSFPVEITVRNLTATQQAMIHIGMSAKVAIETQNGEGIYIPIKAIVEKDGKNYVNILDKKSGKPQQVTVSTGKTTLDSVLIEDNLKAGDKILVSS